MTLAELIALGKTSPIKNTPPSEGPPEAGGAYRQSLIWMGDDVTKLWREHVGALDTDDLRGLARLPFASGQPEASVTAAMRASPAAWDSEWGKVALKAKQVQLYLDNEQYGEPRGMIKRVLAAEGGDAGRFRVFLVGQGMDAVLGEQRKRPLFHPKVFVVALADQRRPGDLAVLALVGSGNLSGGGLSRNSELFVAGVRLWHPSGEQVNAVSGSPIPAFLDAWPEIRDLLRAARPAERDYRNLENSEGDESNAGEGSRRVAWPTQPIGGDRLHDYQRGVRDKVKVRRTGGRTVVSMPTGSGKTLVAAAIVREFLDEAFRDRRTVRVVWLVSIIELLRQGLFRVVAECAGVDGLGVWSYHPRLLATPDDGPKGAYAREDVSFTCSASKIRGERQVYFCTAQSADKQHRQLVAQADLIVVDECHEYPARTGDGPAKELGHTGILQYANPAARVIGLTGTLRKDKGWTDFWGACNDDPFAVPGSQRCSASAHVHPDHSFDELVQLGYLSKTEVLSAETIRVTWDREAPVANSEAEERWLKKLVHERGELVSAISERLLSPTGEVRKRNCSRILVFAATIGDAEALRVLLCTHLRVGVYHSAHRRSQGDLRWYREDPKDSRFAETRVLITVMMGAIGVDIPKVDCVVLGRPTHSHLLKSQMIGRGLRGPENGGTDKCCFLDVVGTVRGRELVPFDEVLTPTWPPLAR